MNTLFLANLMGPQGMLILFVLLLLFGARKLPELARGLGQAIREFSKAKNDISDEIMREPTPDRTRQIETQTVQAQPAVQHQAAPNTQPVASSEPAPAPASTNSHV